MGKLIFISGGIKSGKSQFAVELLKNKKEVFFVATAQAKDKEMAESIKKHRQARPKKFITIEESVDIVSKIKNLGKSSNIIVDCINFWVANMLNCNGEEKILSDAKRLCQILKKFHLSVVVSNEVGLSLVSVNPLGRKFQKVLGKVNQIFASCADEFYFMFSGIPLRIK